MSATTLSYKELYQQLKQEYTVVSDGNEYTLGDFMRRRTQIKRENAPILVRPNTENSLVRFGQYITQKMTVSTPPLKDTTMRRFPMRTSFSAALSAVTLCGLLFSFVFFGARAALTQTAESLSYSENGSDELPQEDEQIRQDI